MLVTDSSLLGSFVLCNSGFTGVHVVLFLAQHVDDVMIFVTISGVVGELEE